MKLKLIGIGLLLVTALLRADDDASLDAPGHLTLTVNSVKDGTLSWDPIDREDLEGYSIWMRKGPGDFTRLDIPTTVHGQELKEPMISKSFLVLKGLGKRQLELAVVAEYESGRSPKSASVFSRLARFVPLSGTAASPAEASEAGSETSLSATSGSAATAAQPEATPSETPESDALVSNGTPSYKHLRSVMAPQGTFHSSVRGDFIWEQINSSGDASLNQLGRSIVGGDPVPADQVESYSSAYVTQIIREALTMEYGLLPNMELGVEEDYSDEREYAQNFYFDGVNYESENSEEAQEGSAFMNPIVKVRIQPLASQPLRLTLWGNFATGSRSRFQAWGDYWRGFRKWLASTTMRRA